MKKSMSYDERIRRSMRLSRILAIVSMVLALASLAINVWWPE